MQYFNILRLKKKKKVLGVQSVHISLSIYCTKMYFGIWYIRIAVFSGKANKRITFWTFHSETVGSPKKKKKATQTKK